MAEISGEQVRKFFQKVIPARFRSDTTVVPVVRLTGVIGFSTPLRPGITISGVARLLDRAFSYTRAKAVALIINGFAKEVLNQLPMEFAVEAQKLLAISLEGSVG